MTTDNPKSVREHGPKEPEEQYYKPEAVKLPASDGTCKNCGSQSLLWFAPNEIWNKVVPEISGLLCPSCFIKKAFYAGVDVVWQLSPEVLPAVPQEKPWSAHMKEHGREEYEILAHPKAESAKRPRSYPVGNHAFGVEEERIDAIEANRYMDAQAAEVASLRQKLEEAEKERGEIRERIEGIDRCDNSHPVVSALRLLSDFGISVGKACEFTRHYLLNGTIDPIAEPEGAYPTILDEVPAREIAARLEVAESKLSALGVGEGEVELPPLGKSRTFWSKDLTEKELEVCLTAKHPQLILMVLDERESQLLESLRANRALSAENAELKERVREFEEAKIRWRIDILDSDRRSYEYSDKESAEALFNSCSYPCNLIEITTRQRVIAERVALTGPAKEEE